MGQAVTSGSSGDAAAEIVRLTNALAAQAQAADDERDRLTHELGHRVKNTLSVVQALANQTLKGAPDPAAALDAFAERIGAMARASDAMMLESWTTATLGAVANAVLSPHGQPIGPLEIDGPEWRLRANGALSFAMALHELATNAKRHGAWSVPGGRVSLRWGADGPDSLHRLTWRETGGPSTSRPTTLGFGLRFAERSLRSAFGRDTAFLFEPDGMQCRAAWRPDDVEA